MQKKLLKEKKAEELWWELAVLYKHDPTQLLSDHQGLPEVSSGSPWFLTTNPSPPANR
jgi:hypothetical protein